MEAHQEPSGTAGQVTDTSVQTTSTPPATVTQAVVTQEDDKEETQDNEESAIQTLAELPIT